MSKRNLSIIGFLTVLMLLSSCSSRKKFVYLQDMNVEELYQFDTKHEAVVHPNDRLKIVVSCEKPALAMPFNARGSAVQMREDGTVASVGSSGDNDYRVGVDGCIDYPVLGSIKVEGMKLNEVKELIAKRIIEEGYINDPLVSVDIVNFKYVVLGATGSNGIFTVEDGRITLIEAIAKAGDLTPNARIDQVKVIREEGDGRKVYTHDLREKAVFNSPAFYLQQNDIVYVEPKYKKKDAEDRGIQYTTLILSIASSMTTLLWYLDRQ